MNFDITASTVSGRLHSLTPPDWFVLLRRTPLAGLGEDERATLSLRY